MAWLRETKAGVVLACAVLTLSPAAAAGSTFEPEEGVICVADSCQPLPPEPEDPSPGTLVPNPGNPPRHIFEPRKKRQAKRHRHHHPHNGQLRLALARGAAA